MKKTYLKPILALCLCAVMLAGCSAGNGGTPSNSNGSNSSGDLSKNPLS